MTNDMSAVVTGGGTGMGRAIAERLVRGGYAVTIVGRRLEVLDATVADLAGVGPGRIRRQVADLTEPSAARPVVYDHVDAYGGIDALVTAAALSTPVPFLQTTEETWNATMDVGLRGTVLIAVEAARHMVAAGGGRIVLFSSVNGFHSEPDTADYSAAKAAVSSLAKSMAVDLGPSGVITNAIAPGWVATAMTQDFLDASSPEALRGLNVLGRVGRPEEIADVAWFLIDQAPAFMIGTTVYVDGGQTIAAPMP